MDANYQRERAARKIIFKPAAAVTPGKPGHSRTGNGISLDEQIRKTILLLEND